MAEDRGQWLASLDPGIAPYVDMLDSAGIETFESCEGTKGHGFFEPTIRFYGDNSEGFRALAVAVQRELPVAELRRYWQVSRAGEPEGPHWELTFREPAAICRPCTSIDDLLATQHITEPQGIDSLGSPGLSEDEIDSFLAVIQHRF